MFLVRYEQGDFNYSVFEIATRAPLYNAANDRRMYKISFSHCDNLQDLLRFDEKKIVFNLFIN